VKRKTSKNNIQWAFRISSHSFPEKVYKLAGWFIPIILATQEAEIRRISVQSQPGQTVCKILSQRNPSQKKVVGIGGLADWLKVEFLI
jgi:hypothetical protein